MIIVKIQLSCNIEEVRNNNTNKIFNGILSIYFMNFGSKVN